jgi:hypothetical protein
VHDAFAPSAQWENTAQQPATAQSQIGLSTKTEWQIAIASHAASVVTLQGLGSGVGQYGAAQANPSPGPAQPVKVWPPVQLGQYSGVQSLRPLHEVSSRLPQVC